MVREQYVRLHFILEGTLESELSVPYVLATGISGVYGPQNDFGNVGVGFEHSQNRKHLAIYDTTLAIVPATDYFVSDREHPGFRKATYFSVRTV
jgi:hypothetical protein